MNTLMTRATKTIVAALLIGALSTQAIAQEWNRQPVVVYVPGPPEPKVVYRPMNGLWIAGLAIFVGGYLLNITGTAIGDSNSLGTSAIPLAGPWIQFDAKYANSTNQLIGQSLFALDGIVQVAGAAMMVIGLSVWRKQTRWSEAPRFYASPWLAPTGGGLQLTWTPK